MRKTPISRKERFLGIFERLQSRRDLEEEVTGATPVRGSIHGDRMLIGVMGRIGAGKDAVAEYLVNNYGFQQIAFRDLVVEEAHRRGLDPTRENLAVVQKDCRARYGDDYFPKEVVRRTETSKARDVVITGIRTSTDARVLKEHFGDKIRLVLVDADAGVRFQRMVKRRRLGDPTVFEDFKEQERLENEHFDSEKAFAQADVTIDNSGTLVQLQEKVDRLVR